MGKNELIDLTLYLHHETDRAYLVSDTGEEDAAVWVPKSQCEFNARKPGSAVCEFTMAEWLAQAKGLI